MCQTLVLKEAISIIHFKDFIEKICFIKDYLYDE